MLQLLTGNFRKYEPLGDLLAQLQITLRVPGFDLPELQDEDFTTVLSRKARSASEAMGGPCLVDDSGLLLDAYPGFPGPMTRSVCKLLGADGMERLLAGVTARARMVCHIGCWVRGELWHWQGEMSGRLDPRRPAAAGPGPLTQWFVPDEPGPWAVFLHRRRALEALGRDIERLRLAVGQDSTPDSPVSATAPHGELCAADTSVAAQAAQPQPSQRNSGNPSCVFCQEFDGHASSIFQELSGGEIPSRVIHQTEHFLVFPPLGQFVEGGLLLTTRAHVISMAHLSDDAYEDLERLIRETSDLLLTHYGCRPLFFEHAPVSSGDKGTCCVDHAHLNVFPARVDVHRQLKKFPCSTIGRMHELAQANRRGQAYLFLQDNEGTRFVYDAGIVPSQYVRKIVTAALGMPERWHWREYLGLDELKRTIATLSPWRSNDASDR